jgi:hypothetical protein
MFEAYMPATSSNLVAKKVIHSVRQRLQMRRKMRKLLVHPEFAVSTVNMRELKHFVETTMTVPLIRVAKMVCASMSVAIHFLVDVIMDGAGKLVLRLKSPVKIFLAYMVVAVM